MTPCDEQLLSTYADGELSADASTALEAHLRECAACASKLARVREASRLLREYPFEDLRADELRHAHAAIDAAADRPILRLGFTLGVLAASVLIVSCAWLLEMPNGRPVPPGNSAIVATSADAPQWERMAMTLRADPLPHPSDDASKFADAQLAEQLAEQHADWVLSGLSRDN